MSKFTISAEFLPDKSDLRFTAYRCTGTTVSGLPYDGVLGLEMEGRDVDWDGTEFDGDDFDELMDPLLDGSPTSIWGTPAWIEGDAWWKALCARSCWVCDRQTLTDVDLVHEWTSCQECREARCHHCGAEPTTTVAVWGVTSGIPREAPEGADKFRYVCGSHSQEVFDDWYTELLLQGLVLTATEPGVTFREADGDIEYRVDMRKVDGIWYAIPEEFTDPRAKRGFETTWKQAGPGWVPRAECPAWEQAISRRESPGN